MAAFPRAVLVDVLPGGVIRDVAVVVGAAGFVGLLGNVAVPLPFTPVPLSLATFAVLLSGAALGPWRGGLSMLLYMVAGMAGLPWFAGQNSGWQFPSFGYIVGYVVAAVAIGVCARRGADRAVGPTAGAMAFGNVIIYACGLPWLMLSTGADLAAGLRLGVIPFLVGDAMKLALAAGLLPATWRWIASVRS